MAIIPKKRRIEQQTLCGLHESLREGVFTSLLVAGDDRDGECADDHTFTNPRRSPVTTMEVMPAICCEDDDDGPEESTKVEEGVDEEAMSPEATQVTSSSCWGEGDERRARLHTFTVQSRLEEMMSSSLV